MDTYVNYSARDEAYATPLDKIDVSDPRLYYNDTWYPYFERLRREDPVHFTPESPYGPYWAVTKYRDMVKVEVNHKVFSSSDDLGGIRIEDPPKGMERPSFIRMDPPEHDDQRLVVGPTVAPGNLAKMESMIRERTCRVLDGLPREEEFNWVDRVSIELTSMMLATLFDYPIEERRALIRWSEIAICDINAPGRAGPNRGRALRRAGQVHRAHERIVGGAGEAAAGLRHHLDPRAQRHDEPHAAARADGDPHPVPGRRQRHDAQLDVGRGLGLSRYPEEFAKVRANRDLIPGLIPEIVRWQTGHPYAAHRDRGCRDRR